MTARILVAEDEAALSALLEYNLSHEGYTVRVCGDGDEAQLALDEDAPDLVLLDWMLPGVSGLEICRRIRARPETRDVPVIMITARGEEEDRVRGLNTGADDYMTKPLSMAELSARIKAVLRRTRPALAGDVASFGDISLDREVKRVRRGERFSQLTEAERNDIVERARRLAQTGNGPAAVTRRLLSFPASRVTVRRFFSPP